MATTDSLIAKVQDRIAARLGLQPEHRPEAVRAMMRPRVGEGVGYWLQLMMAAALATLGLALDSTAVVIGAMLIAPLMKPIIELAMGLATGSAPLVFRAGVRSVASVASVVIAAALITWLLPFHDLTRELIARTAPSLIDLFVAAACALAGAYATMFSSSDMASTAAGTSIGISLVPPLCTAGYALSVGHWKMALGAALLFTANITGIIAVASVVFALVGFGQVDIHEAEVETEINLDGVASRIGKNWSKASRRLGRVSRVLLPVLLLAAIFVPLRRAVAEMSRRSAIRQEIGQRLADKDLRVAQSSIELDAEGATVRVVIVGDAVAARLLDEELRQILVRNGEAEPRLSVWAVPDARALGALATKIDDLPPPVVAEPVKPMATRSPAEIAAAVAKAWPEHGAGERVATWLEAGSPTTIRVAHFAPQLGEAGRDLLAAAIAPEKSVVVVEDVLDTVDAARADAMDWASRALPMVELARGLPGIVACVVVPAPPLPAAPRAKPTTEPAEVGTIRELVTLTLSTWPAATIAQGDRWTLVLQRAPCAAPAVAP
ncbi:MAG: DUF389 domain-containing protein [Deltaproteobacteria bacterium]